MSMRERREIPTGYVPGTGQSPPPSNVPVVTHEGVTTPPVTPPPVLIVDPEGNDDAIAASETPIAVATIVVPVSGIFRVEARADGSISVAPADPTTARALEGLLAFEGSDELSEMDRAATELPDVDPTEIAQEAAEGRAEDQARAASEVGE